MEFTYFIPIKTWEDGFEWEYEGLVNRLDELNHLIYLEQQNDDRYIVKIRFEDIIQVEVNER